MCDADVRIGFFNKTLNLLRINAAAFCVDICAVRLVVRDRHFRAKLAQNARRRLIGSAVRHIDGDAHFVQRHAARKARLGKFDIATKRVIDARGTSDFSSSRPDGIDFASENELLDLLLHLIVELVAIVPEKFNAVIFVGIM